ncbi:MAG: response regulator transcription factor, partial [Bacteroidota bacterium]
MTSLFLVEDHPVFIAGLRATLNDSSEFIIKDTARNGKEAIVKMQAMQHDPPEIILMDLRMPEMDGIEATKLIKEDFPNCRIIILTGHKERGEIKNSMSANVDGYMLKDSVGDEIRKAIKEIKKG